MIPLVDNQKRAGEILDWFDRLMRHTASGLGISDLRTFPDHGFGWIAHDHAWEDGVVSVGDGSEFTFPVIRIIRLKLDYLRLNVYDVLVMPLVGALDEGGFVHDIRHEAYFPLKISRRLEDGDKKRGDMTLQEAIATVRHGLPNGWE